MDPIVYKVEMVYSGDLLLRATRGSIQASDLFQRVNEVEGIDPVSRIDVQNLAWKFHHLKRACIEGYEIAWDDYMKVEIARAEVDLANLTSKLETMLTQLKLDVSFAAMNVTT